VKSDAEPWSLPEFWAWTTMGEVADVVGGSTPSTGESENFARAGIPWITPADLSGYSAKLIARGKRDISQKGLASSPARLMPAGTVLFSSRAPIGYVAIAANPVTTNQGFKSFVLSTGVLPDYAYHWLVLAKDLLSAFASGTTFPEISGKRAHQIPLPLAPFQEQIRIVAAIESHLTKLDAALAVLHRARANLKRYRASVLKAAVEGRLAPKEAELARKEGRDYEPASVLLNRILAERCRRWEESELARMKAAGKPPKDDRWKSKYNEPIAPDACTLPRLPEGWCWSTADQLASGEEYANTIGPFGSNLKVSDYTESGVPLVFVRNIRSEHFGDPESKFISEMKAATLRPHCVFPGDILVTKMGDPPGDACTYPPDRPAGVITADCIRWAATQLLPRRDLLVQIVRSGLVRRQITSMTKGVAQRKVSLGRFRRLAIPLPPIAEQERILAEIDRLLSVANQNEKVLQVSVGHAERLRQAILNWAFEGKLVDQDPSDEPASVLLERIRGERAAAMPPPKARKPTVLDAEAAK
jgi:type I restriction enzyme S subunit